ncbi:MAG: flagellar hook-length control protein FliK [bacterium]
MVNPILSANIIASIGMPALIGSTTSNTSAITPESNNFKDVISNLLTTEASKENLQLGVDASSNEKIKSALYQAATIINLNGDIGKIVTLDNAAISNDMIVSSIMQNNNLSSAERTIFVKALKATAIEIVLNGAALNIPKIPTESALLIPDNKLSSSITTGNTPVKVAIEVPVSNVNSVITTPVIAAATIIEPDTTAKIIIPQDKNLIFANEPLEILPKISSPVTSVVVPPIEAVTSLPVTVVQPTVAPLPPAIINILPTEKILNLSQNIVKPVDNLPVVLPISVPVDLSNTVAVLSQNNVEQTPFTPVVLSTEKPLTPEVANKVITAPVNDKNVILSQLANLTNQLDNILNSFSVPKVILPNVNAPIVPLQNDVNAEIQIIKTKIDDIKSILASGTLNKVQLDLLKETISEISISFNNVLASVQPVIATATPQPIAIQTNNSKEVNNVILSTPNQTNFSEYKYAITTSNQTQDFNNTMEKIVNLLNSLDGTISVVNKPVYVVRPDIALEMAVNTPSFQQLKAAQEIVVSVPQMAIATADTNTQTNSVTTSILQSVTVQPQLVATKTQTDSNVSINTAIPVKTVSAVTAEAVQTISKATFEKFVEIKQDATPKNIISDVRWIADNIIKPAALSNEAAALVNDKQILFDRVAEFVASIKEQIVVRQVVSNINDSAKAPQINEIKMVLKPENLGSVYIKLEHGGGEIKGSIMVTNDAVRETLRANLPELRTALSNIGVAVSNLDISMSNSNTGAAFQDNGRNNFTQWQNPAHNMPVENIEIGIESFVNANGYFNYLA